MGHMNCFGTRNLCLRAVTSTLTSSAKNCEPKQKYCTLHKLPSSPNLSLLIPLLFPFPLISPLSIAPHPPPYFSGGILISIRLHNVKLNRNSCCLRWLALLRLATLNNNTCCLGGQACWSHDSVNGCLSPKDKTSSEFSLREFNHQLSLWTPPPESGLSNVCFCVTLSSIEPKVLCDFTLQHGGKLEFYLS